MTAITLTVQPTANPDIIKLKASRSLIKDSCEYKNVDEVKNTPLAKELFYLPFIKTVYISSNLIALKRFPIIEWRDVQEEVAQQIAVYLQSGRPLINNDSGRTPVEVSLCTETTPNPVVMKFIANKRLVPTIIEYKSVTGAAGAPSAQTLFQVFPFITEVFFDNDYILVTKTDIASWEEESPRLRAFIKDYLAAEKTVTNISGVKKWQTAVQAHLLSKVTTDPTSQQIVAIIEEHIKPAVTSDGGNIQFISYQSDAHHVEMLLQGACSGCPSSTQTPKKGVEAMLKNKLGNPDINVEAV